MPGLDRARTSPDATKDLLDALGSGRVACRSQRERECMLDATCRPRHVMRWSRKRDGERRNGARGEKEEKEKAKATCILDRDAMREDRGGRET